MSRWTEKDMAAMAHLREACKADIEKTAPFPDVVGDRRIMRFLEGGNNSLENSCKLYSNFLKWRRQNNVDEIRQQIMYGGRNDPSKFPFGDKVLKHCQQIVFSATAVDKKGRPIMLEQYEFNPKELLKEIPLADYTIFFIYCMEFRMMIMEEMSHAAEMKYLQEHPNPADRKDGYGVVLYNCSIRDLKREFYVIYL